MLAPIDRRRSNSLLMSSWFPSTMLPHAKASMGDPPTSCAPALRSPDSLQLSAPARSWHEAQSSQMSSPGLEDSLHEFLPRACTPQTCHSQMKLSAGIVYDCQLLQSWQKGAACKRHQYLKLLVHHCRGVNIHLINGRLLNGGLHRRVSCPQLSIHTQLWPDEALSTITKSKFSRTCQSRLQQVRTHFHCALKGEGEAPCLWRGLIQHAQDLNAGFPVPLQAGLLLGPVLGVGHLTTCKGHQKRSQYGNVYDLFRVALSF